MSEDKNIEDFFGEDEYDPIEEKGNFGINFREIGIGGEIEVVGQLLMAFISKSELISVQDPNKGDKDQRPILIWAMNSSEQMGQFIKECFIGIPVDSSAYPGEIHPAIKSFIKEKELPENKKAIVENIISKNIEDLTILRESLKSTGSKSQEFLDSLEDSIIILERTWEIHDRMDYSIPKNK